MEARFRAAAAQMATYISQQTSRVVDAVEKPAFVGTLLAAQTLVLAAVDPSVTLVARAAAQLELPASGDPLRPRLGAPQFPRPMSLALTPQQLLPGVDTVPDETAAMLVTNPRFVESFMIGVNDEMRRELAWRQYPVDSRATFFANFWGATPDIPPIAGWSGGNPLGATADTQSAEVVLLLRGELLRRYPNTVISAVQATSDDPRTLSSNERLPVFRGAIDPDMTFFGFALTLAEATTDPGWYFVLSEHPSEPRFGLEPAATAAGALSTWNKLGWSQVVADGLVVNNHVGFSKPLGAAPPPEGGAWGENSAQQAFITYRRPIRVALLATALLGA
jgi:hypothetical protein